MDRQDFETRPAVSLDASKLLGFSNLARVLAADETMSVVELSRLLSKIGTELPPPDAAEKGSPMGRLLSKISETPAPDSTRNLLMSRLLSKIGDETTI